MSEVSVMINGRPFNIACDDGQEQRVFDLANFVDSRLKQIKMAGAGTNEQHLLVLTSILMADEMFEMRDNSQNSRPSVPLGSITISEDEEYEIVDAIDQMTDRIKKMAGGMGKM